MAQLRICAIIPGIWRNRERKTENRWDFDRKFRVLPQNPQGRANERHHGVTNGVTIQIAENSGEFVSFLAIFLSSSLVLLLGWDDLVAGPHRLKYFEMMLSKPGRASDDSLG
jgi:hypothetical protein